MLFNPLRKKKQDFLPPPPVFSKKKQEVKYTLHKWVLFKLYSLYVTCRGGDSTPYFPPGFEPYPPTKSFPPTPPPTKKKTLVKTPSGVITPDISHRVRLKKKKGILRHLPDQEKNKRNFFLKIFMILLLKKSFFKKNIKVFKKNLID